MSREGILQEMITNKHTWKMRPPDVTKAAVAKVKDQILSAENIWLDLQAHNIKDSVGIEELRRTDSTAFEHAITNFWMVVWMWIKEGGS